MKYLEPKYSLRDNNFPLGLSLIALVSGALISYLLYILLPELNFYAHLKLFEPTNLAKVIVVLPFALIYLFITIKCLINPSYIFYGILLTGPILFYLNLLLDVARGQNILSYVSHSNFKGLAPCLPIGFLLLVLYGWHVLIKLPHIKYLFLFALVVVVYYFTFSSNVKMIEGAFDATFREIKVKDLFLTSYFIIAVGIGTASACFFRLKDHLQFFDKFNLLLLYISLNDSILSIIGFPIGFLSAPIDGYERSYSRFTHPNTFAHHTGLLLFYFLGLLLYYNKTGRSTKHTKLLPLCVVATILSMFLALSKTSIGLGIICGAIFLLFNLRILNLKEKQQTFLAIGLGIVLAIVGVLFIQLLTGIDFFQVIQARIEDTSSYSWRERVWSYLLSDIHTIFGHGMSSANEILYDRSYDQIYNQTPLIPVHNGYIQTFYDFGALGFLLFFSIASLVLNGLKTTVQNKIPSLVPLGASCICMTVYYLGVLANDEMLIMYDAAFLFWTLTTILLLFINKELKLAS